MDCGAHFYRCDFQVHTPRDINWSGEKPTADLDRKEYSRRFISACREKGLDAVAITDHHDLTFYSYIREAAETELSETGELVSAEKRIHVFPGLELTLAVPCQALLLFDETFPVEFFGPVMSRLGITSNSPEEASHQETTRLTNLTSLQKIHDELDLLSYAKWGALDFWTRK